MKLPGDTFEAKEPKPIPGCPFEQGKKAKDTEELMCLLAHVRGGNAWAEWRGWKNPI